MIAQRQTVALDDDCWADRQTIAFVPPPAVAPDGDSHDSRTGRWRRRGQDDYDWDDDEEDGKRILPECIYRYDPMELDDYDPPEDF